MNIVPEKLRSLAAIYEERNKVYGNNYKIFGGVMAALFPEGLTLQTAEDWNRVGVMIQIVSKLSRYSRRWGDGHKDSLDDLAVYTMMLQELDDEMRSTPIASGARSGWPIEVKS